MRRYRLHYVVDAAWLKLQSTKRNNLPPKIALLISAGSGFTRSGGIQKNLFHSITPYRDQFLERPEYGDGIGWDDLEALQQVTPSDMNERWLGKMMQKETQQMNP